MKLFGKLLIAVLIIGILLPFTILKGKDGRPLMNFSNLKMPDFNMPSMPELPGVAKTDTAGKLLNSGGGNTTIYQWKDIDGNIQFTTSPPPAGIEYTVKGYDPNTNVIQSVKLPENEVEKSESENNTGNPLDEGIGTAYSPEKIQKLFDDAKNVEKLLNDRLEKQNAAIGD